MSQNENMSLLARCLERIEDDWHRIEGDWGPTAGGLEGDIQRGDETLIPELRAAVAAYPSPWLPIDGAPKDGTELLLRSKKERIANGVWVAVNGSLGYWAWPYVNVEPILYMPIPPLPEVKP